MGCIGCGKCSQTKRCWYDTDTVNRFLEKVDEADGFIFGTPIHFAGPSGFIKPFMDRAFCSKASLYTNKPAATVVSCSVAAPLPDLTTLTSITVYATCLQCLLFIGISARQ